MGRFKTRTHNMSYSEEFTRVSDTEPSMVPSLRDMLVRHRNGIRDSVQYEPAFSGDMPDTRNWSRAEIQEALDKANKDKEYFSLINEQQIAQIRDIEYKSQRKRQREEWEKYQQEQQSKL